MKAGPWITALVAVGALTGGGYVFLTSSVPYVSVADAKAKPNQNVHVAGDILHNTAQMRLAEGVFEFDLKDEKGGVMRVRYKGPKPANFDSAPKVSVGGYFESGVFHSDQILVKCPSKYESEKAAGA